MKHFLFFAVLVCSICCSFAQEVENVDSLNSKKNDLKNSIRIEFLGKSPFFGLNYDRMIWKSNLWRLNTTLGVSISDLGMSYSTSCYVKRKASFSPLVGLSVNSNFKKNNTYQNESVNSPIFCFLLIGIEKKILKSLDIQLYYSPVIKLLNKELAGVLYIYGGLNVGYKF